MENTKTTFRPILFSTPMVQAILENRKRLTRRTKGLEEVNKNPDNWKFEAFGKNPDNEKDKRLCAYFTIKGTETWYYQICPYNIGDVLWVRETFCEPNLFDGHENDFYYKADNIDRSSIEARHIANVKWKPSIFMPKQACRNFLKIKSIRVERLQDISEEDAKKEGIKVIEMDEAYFDYQFNGKNGSFANAKGSFSSLWILINGEESWNQNPFVFVYEFEQIEKPKDFIL